MERVRIAADKVARLEPRLEAERARLHEAILDAHREGASLALIARAANLSRERVRQIVARGGR